MFTSKLARYSVFFFPVAVFLISPFADPIKRYFLHRYDVRWIETRDEERRTQTIAVYNGSDRPMPKVLVELDIHTPSDRPVADLRFSHLESSPGVSFFETLAAAAASADLPKSDVAAITNVTDSHSSNRTLAALDQAFDEILITRLTKDKAQSRAAVDLLRFDTDCFNWHQEWLDKCKGKLTASGECGLVNNTLEDWEQTKRKIHEEAYAKWHTATEVRRLNPEYQMSPKGKLFFSFPLQPEETGFLHLSYGPALIQATKPRVIASTLKEVTNVVADGDLRAPLLILSLKYNTLLTVGFALVLCFGLIVAWHAVTVKMKPAYQLFNMARETEQPEYWELAFQSHRLDIMNEYHKLRLIHARPGAGSLEPEAVLGHVKSMLRMHYDVNPREFKDNSDLDRFLSIQLWQLVKKL